MSSLEANGVGARALKPVSRSQSVVGGSVAARRQHDAGAHWRWFWPAGRPPCEPIAASSSTPKRAHPRVRLRRRPPGRLAAWREPAVEPEKRLRCLLHRAAQARSAVASAPSCRLVRRPGQRMASGVLRVGAGKARSICARSSAVSRNDLAPGSFPPGGRRGPPLGAHDARFARAARRGRAEQGLTCKRSTKGRNKRCHDAPDRSISGRPSSTVAVRAPAAAADRTPARARSAR